LPTDLALIQSNKQTTDRFFDDNDNDNDNDNNGNYGTTNILGNNDADGERQ